MVGGNCLKYLRRQWNRKEVRGNKDLKKRGDKLGQGVGALKKEGLEPPHKLWSSIYKMAKHTLKIL